MGELNLDFTEKILLDLIELVYRHTGISMNTRKENLIRTRLRPRMRELKMQTFEEYVAHLESNREEVEIFINLLTTNETTFFRTPRIWEYFQHEFLDHWKRESVEQCLNIWSAAASTGEEAYSISMSCLENGVHNFKILGTDISTEVLEAARAGTCAEKNFKDLSLKYPHLKEKYFDQSGETLIARKILKEHIQFQQHNLFQVLNSKIQFDVVFLRNVLIYFNNEDQAKVLKNLSRSLKSGGILILGESESISRLETNFKYKSPLIYINE